MSFPVCMTVLFSAFLVYGQMDGMAATTALMRVINTALNTYENVLDIPVIPGIKETSAMDGFNIIVDKASFSYGERQIIHKMTANMPERSVTAIVGPSGSGKTTLCNLIARFWDVQEGAVSVGGMNIKELRSDALLSQISMVFQNVYLFNDSIENNIKFGNPDAGHDEVVAAATKARCHEFISRLPDGYDTIIGEGGSTLSGGEKQRISIARAILKDAPIVILDEATSSVDPENEYALILAIKELTKGKTLITIAHRLSTVREADQILVLADGRIVQNGNHETLAKQPGIYRNFLRICEQAAAWRL